jgi:hypothetical protein
VVRLLAALAGLLLAGASPIFAQRDRPPSDRPQLDIALSASNVLDGPSISTTNLLADSRTRELLRNGMPTQVHYRLELWRKGRIFNDPAGRTEWDVLVQYDPLAQLYNVVRRIGKLRETFIGKSTVTAAAAQFEGAFRVPLVPDKSGRYYYHLVIDVQTLTESDLDALQQWIRGPDAPGKANPISTIRSGVGTMVSRLLGNKNSYEQQSSDFSMP